jgi:hypothetical protein
MHCIYRERCARRRLMLGLALLALAGSSCSKLSRRVCHPVEGKVFFQGQPAAGALVFFHPTGAHDPKDEYFEPAGVVEADGRFRLMTYETEEGAPAGEYTVTVTWRQSGVKGDEELLDAWPQRYESAVTSGLRARVQDSPTQLEPFQLTNAPGTVSSGERDLARGR